MTDFGHAPTQTITRVATAPRTTAPAPVTPATVRPGTLVTYTGTFYGAAGNWICDGGCPCGCGRLRLWRQEADGYHQLVHVSAASVARWARS